MITTFIFNIAGWFFGFMFYPLVLVSQMVFGGADMLLGISLVDFLTWLFTPLWYFDDIFPIRQIVSAMAFLTVFYMFVYISRFLMWILSQVPLIGSAVKLPFFGKTISETGGHFTDYDNGIAKSDRSWWRKNRTKYIWE